MAITTRQNVIMFDLGREQISRVASGFISLLSNLFWVYIAYVL